ncbi:succinate dehydrogenase, cytochrome b556 subunit [Candidatus Erwinia haradaeae]|uniref:Succinate dehydrogenase cytochrome b556 subunit n=1 Tax=Candidatus Erwinia haradaeae TaxID=1922217 RepID=A0A803FUK6_9GAMM|nr:succinate dehydrogenase, cytochrome b556 subunit [Candidatus Erwinia haradaeae]VFP88864.1 Succinate dehydrogenase cytochrome b556 subunit [Candidatus Erwinia haradaeae]
MKKQRPVNLNFSTICFPLTAIISILHRISGVITFFSIGILLWLLGLSLSSPKNFLEVSTIINSLHFKFIAWVLVSTLSFHFIGGIRHLIMDFGLISTTLKTGKISSKVVLGSSILLAILSGVVIW